MMNRFLSITCALAALASAVNAQSPSARGARSTGAVTIQAEGPEDSLYRVARQAGIDGDYRRSAALLKELVDKYPRSAKAGDALYWRAWALHKIGVDRRSRPELDDALAAIDRQQKSYATASTASDGRVLRTQILSAQANLGDARAAGDIATQSKALSQSRPCTGSRSDEETRIAALEGLLSMNAADALPILRDVLKQHDACRVELRKKAVWLVSAKGGSDVATTLLDVARTDPSSDVRAEAVFWLGQTRNVQVIPLLDSILINAKDEEIQKKAIFSLAQFKTDRSRQALRRVAEDEGTPAELRGEAIFWMGSDAGIDLPYYKTLFEKAKSSEIRERIVFIVSQRKTPAASAWLLEMARDKTVDSETRKNVIFNLSQQHLIDVDGLSAIYDQAKGDGEIQDQILFVYSSRSERAAVDKLMDVAKSDPSIERRKQALFWLGQKDDPRVKQFIRDLIYK